jgi:hypothetical protein
MTQKKKKQLRRVVAIKVLFALFFQIAFPTASLALTGGPSQPEVEAFTPIGTSDMVDISSGNFNYNLPLMDVEGYPVNISYSSGVTMDQEASCVGLGWNLNVGALTRSMRGLPDDFKGESIKKELKYQRNWSVGAGFGAGFEFTGKNIEAGLNVGQNIVYNNYKGISIEPSVSGTLNAGNKLKSGKTEFLGLSLSLRSTETGLTASPNFSYGRYIDKAEKAKGSVSMGLSIHSREGLKNLSLGYSVSVQTDNTRKNKKTGKTENAWTKNGGNASIDFGYQTYVPSSDMQMRNLSFSASFEPGTTIFAADATWNVNAYYSAQSLVNNTEYTNGYGYMYSGEGQKHTNALLDYNREKDGSFTKFTPHLGLTNFSYDVLNAAGHGVSGAYRPFRSDLGYVYDKEVSSVPDLSFDAGVELGAGNIAKVGVDVAVNVVQNVTTSWTSQNPASGNMRFKDNISDKPAYEGVYFKQAGERSVDSDPALYNLIGGTAPVNFVLSEAGKFNVYNTNQLNGGGTISSTNTTRSVRQRRNQNFSYLTLDQYAGAMQPSLSSTISGSAQPHHMAEVTVQRPDGVRYIYGLPAYNTTQQEVSFNISSSSGIPLPQTQYSYDPLHDVSISNSGGNEHGKDHFVSKVTTPPYAHSYMLTAIVSPDYVDMGTDGPSPDDLGSYTKFTYERTTEHYKWRIPYEENQANFNEMLKTLNYDDQGSYTYGEKELWYVKMIETKNYVAKFDYNPRKDGHGVNNDAGGLGSATMQLLKSISLYTRPEYYTSPGVVNPSAVPVKKVNFVYNYELCRGVPNNDPLATLDPGCEIADPGGSNNGKLTLKEVYFTYQNSFRAKLNSYRFTYSSQNPNYNANMTDRWGAYKNELSTISNRDFPYSVQDKTDADLNASAWSLSSIKLPSGGEISMEYEADDYAYVQNKKAMKMFRLHGISNNGSLSPTDPTPGTAHNSTSGLETKTCLYFKKEHSSIPAAEYIKGIDNLYFRALVKINGGHNGGYEYVSGYAKIDPSDCHEASDPNYAYIELDQVPLGDSDPGMDVNPITKAAIQFGRLHTTQESFNSSTGSLGSTLKEVADALLFGLAFDVFDMFKGPNRTVFSKGYGQDIQVFQSFIKLNAASGHKFGGDGRVKTLTMNDKWDDMTVAQDNAEYVQKYTYETQEEGKTISSGVAAYEPQVGADENALKKPVFYQSHALLAPDDEFYVEEPFGESFYPSPHITYSKVKVENLTDASVMGNSTGYVIHEFYTSKDYPTRSDRTYLNPGSTMFEHKSSAIAKILKFNVRHYLTASQGYSIVLNDMDGKQKAQWVYQKGKSTPISGVQYFYKDNGTVNAAGVRTPGNKLNNTATVITKSGQVQQAQIGVDYDFVADFREHSTDVTNFATQFNTYGVVIIIPVILPPIWFTSHHEQTQFRSAVATKVVQTYGLLDETIAYDLGSKVATKNLAYDAETGEVLLSKVVNEFEDPLYNMSYPAHWAYEGMGPSYKNTGITFTDKNPASITNANLYFAKGDEVLMKNGSTWSKVWVKNATASGVTLMNDAGTVLSPGVVSILKVIRSGRRNEQSVSVGSITMRKDPSTGTAFPALDASYGIINAGSVQFGNNWKTFCSCGIDDIGNEYRSGILGNYRAVKSYLYLTERTQTKTEKNSNLRKDGQYTDFIPFWHPNSGNDWTPPTDLGTTSRWTFTSEVTNYSPFGMELENRDALNRYSSAVYGYNNTLPTSVSANSKYKQSGADNFEDYDFMECSSDHFSFKVNGAAHINTTQSHTGKRSMEVTGGQKITLTKDLNNCTDEN